MYGIGAYFAILNAVKAFNPGKEFRLSSPMTPEKVLMNLYCNNVNNAVEQKEKLKLETA
jgi:xanthine dehydrogenase large subunit